MTDAWPKNSRGVDCRVLVLRACASSSLAFMSTPLVAKSIGMPVAPTVDLCRRMAGLGWLNSVTGPRRKHERWTITPAGLAQLDALMGEQSEDPRTVGSRIRQALIDLWQDHQAAWPVGSPERRRLRVTTAAVLERAGLDGRKRIKTETAQEFGRRAMRAGQTGLGEHLAFAYDRGTFDVWPLT